MNCNQINRHERDSLIHFEEESHTYTVNGRVLKSQFDADYWAAKKAPAMGMTPEEVKALWERKG